jgi:hypothetical protein
LPEALRGRDASALALAMAEPPPTNTLKESRGAARRARAGRHQRAPGHARARRRSAGARDLSHARFKTTCLRCKTGAARWSLLCERGRGDGGGRLRGCWRRFTSRRRCAARGHSMRSTCTRAGCCAEEARGARGRERARGRRGCARGSPEGRRGVAWTHRAQALVCWRNPDTSWRPEGDRRMQDQQRTILRATPRWSRRRGASCTRRPLLPEENEEQVERFLAPPGDDCWTPAGARAWVRCQAACSRSIRFTRTPTVFSAVPAHDARVLLLLVVGRQRRHLAW